MVKLKKEDLTKVNAEYLKQLESENLKLRIEDAHSKTLTDNKIFQSISRTGNCLDYSVMENFFGILKQELYYGNTFYSYAELKSAIEQYISYYNHKSAKQVLGYFSPVKYRQKNIAA